MCKDKTLFVLRWFGSLALCLGLFGCCECPLQEEGNPVVVCNVREATITEFISTLDSATAIIDGAPTVVYTPVPEYSVHTFEFPADFSSSGELTTDEENFDPLEGKFEIIVAIDPNSFEVGGENFFAAIVDDTPANSDIVGDILVSGVLLPPPPAEAEATIRVYGKLAKHDSNFTSENSATYCAFAQGIIDRDELDDLRDNLREYGFNSPGLTGTQRTYDVIADFDSFVTLDSDGQRVDSPLAPLSNRMNLANRVNTSESIVDIEIRIGEVYYYEARNGLRFLFVITNIAERLDNPLKKRVSIMYVQL